MAEILALLEALGSAAGWVIAVMVLGGAVVGVWRGWWVPGFMYRREVARGDRAEDAVEASTRTVEQAAVATESATRTALAVAEQLAGIQRALDRLRPRDDAD